MPTDLIRASPAFTDIKHREKSALRVDDIYSGLTAESVFR
jgi:hypothetical protein